MKMLGIVLLSVLILCLGSVSAVGLLSAFEAIIEGNVFGGMVILVIVALSALGIYGCVRGIKRLRRKKEA